MYSGALASSNRKSAGTNPLPRANPRGDDAGRICTGFSRQSRCSTAADVAGRGIRGRPCASVCVGANTPAVVIRVGALVQGMSCPTHNGRIWRRSAEKRFPRRVVASPLRVSFHFASVAGQSRPSPVARTPGQARTASGTDKCAICVAHAGDPIGGIRQRPSRS